MLLLAGLQAIGTGSDALLTVEQFLTCLCLCTPLQAPDICLGAPAGGWETDVTPLAMVEDFLGTLISLCSGTPLLAVDIPPL